MADEADVAFLVMDFIFHGRRDLANAFADAYFAASGDAEGRELLPFYTAYRAAVRGKVLQDPEWQAFLGKSAPLLVEMRSVVLIPAPSSPTATAR